MISHLCGKGFLGHVFLYRMHSRWSILVDHYTTSFRMGLVEFLAAGYFTVGSRVRGSEGEASDADE